MPNNYRRKGEINIEPITANSTLSTPINVDGFDYADILIRLENGSGAASYSFKVKYAQSNEIIDLLPNGVGNFVFSQGGNGVYAVRAEIGAASELYIQSVDIATGGYTLTADVYGFSQGDGM